MSLESIPERYSMYLVFLKCILKLNAIRASISTARLAAVIRAERVDIVHARSRAPAWSAWLAARRTGVHFVTTYHAPYGERPRLKRAYNAVMARGEVVIAISRHIAGLVAARHGVDPAASGSFRAASIPPSSIPPPSRRSAWPAWRAPGACRTGAPGPAAARTADPLEGAGGADRGAGPHAPPRRGGRCWSAATRGGIASPPGLSTALAEGSASPTGCASSAMRTTCRRPCCAPTS